MHCIDETLAAGAAAAGLATAAGPARRAQACRQRAHRRRASSAAAARGSSCGRTSSPSPTSSRSRCADVYQPFLDKGVELSGGRGQGVQRLPQLLDDKDVDAVIMATPDHWHALQTVAACRAGKDVYVEKPLSLFVQRGAGHGRRGAQAQARGPDRQPAALGRPLRQGGRADPRGAHRRGPQGDRGLHPQRAARRSSPRICRSSDGNLDWDMWLGPAPKVAFDPFRCLYNFRWFWDYSGGQMTNFGAHHLDIVRWALGAAGPTVGGRLRRPLRHQGRRRDPRRAGGGLPVPGLRGDLVGARDQPRRAPASTSSSTAARPPWASRASGSRSFPRARPQDAERGGAPVVEEKGGDLDARTSPTSSTA